MSPVVLIAFNRPDLTRRVFARIREVKPGQLFVVCDGPRVDHPADAQKVEEVRRIIADGVDWPCEIKTQYAEQNLGCRECLSMGIRWTFSLVEEAIFLEDDCLPDLTFFSFCEAMLERYREDERVMHINGSNFTSPAASEGTSYYFSKYVWVWGWASWRRAWEHYDYTMASWNERLPALSRSFDSRREQAFWMSIFEKARQDWKMAKTWDFSWIYSCWTRGGLTVMPTVNLVENLGFGPDATHTQDGSSHLRMAAGKLHLARHPLRFRRSRIRDDLMFRAYAGETLSLRNNFVGVCRVLFRCLADSDR